MPELRILPERPYRELPGLQGRFLRATRWSWRGNVRPLREDELIIAEAMAYVLAGLEIAGPWRR